jgi:transcriptional regulator with GAF, ATPase, and Fis domain
MLNQFIFSVRSKLPDLSRRNFLLLLGMLIFIYTIAVLIYVMWIPDLGIQSALRPQIKGLRDSREFELDVSKGWVVTKVGDKEIRNWFDLLNAPHFLRAEVAASESQPTWVVKRDGDDRIRVLVHLKSASGEMRTIDPPLDNIPFSDMVPSLLWFALKLGLFVVGGLVLWKRPTDPSAVQFFLLCIVTLGAFTGGYHWSRLVTTPPFFLVFLACAVLLPAVSLHNYHVFPRRKSWLTEHPGWTLGIIYGPTFILLVVLGSIYLNSYFVASTGYVPSDESRAFIERIIYLEFGWAALQYLAGVLCLVHSYRLIVDPMERNQVKFILMGASLALLPIGYSLYLAVADRDAFSAGGATWPMFLASAFITFAYAISITRYRLMELDQIVSSGVGYFATSFVAAALYYLVVFLGTLIFSQYVTGPSLTDALTVSTTALLLFVGLDVARSRIKKALDRRYFRDKSQLDRTLQRLGQEIEKLVDTPSLAIKMLNATAEVLGVQQGAIFLLQQGEPAVYRLAGSIGQAPPLEELSPNYPLVAAMGSGRTILGRARFGPPPSPAQKQLQYLRGEIAQPLTHENRLLAILILGEKDSPYKAEDFDLLKALAQITALAIGSAEGHRIIEDLNKDLQAKVQKISEQQRRILALQSQLTRQSIPAAASNELAGHSDDGLDATAAKMPLPAGIVGSSPVIHQLIDLVRKVAATDAVVLLRGESGTGKELLARAVYETSARVGKPFVKVHCAALAPTLLESELFGHVKGAFTGAHKDKIGRFELANGGTLFLDEIGDISIEVQTKLLRVLQEKTIERVGSAESIAVDVRIITATHQNLENLIRQGRFREDLFYRLNVFPIHVPPLRERVEDIEDLARFFVQQSAQTCKKDVASIDDEALELLLDYPWPGNIRELQNVIERAVVIAEGTSVTVEDLPRELLRRDGGAREAVLTAAEGAPLRSTRPLSARRQERLRREREELLHALATADGNKAQAARALGMARSTLVSRLKKLGLD